MKNLVAAVIAFLTSFISTLALAFDECQGIHRSEVSASSANIFNFIVILILVVAAALFANLWSSLGENIRRLKFIRFVICPMFYIVATLSCIGFVTVVTKAMIELILG